MQPNTATSFNIKLNLEFPKIDSGNDFFTQGVMRMLIMEEEKICPICQTEIPTASNNICPECLFDLGRLEEESEPPKKGKIGKPYIAGILGSIISGGCMSIFFLASDNWNPELGTIHLVLFFSPIIGFLPGGLIAGAIGDYLSKKIERPENRVQYIILSFLIFLVIAFLGLILGYLCTCSSDTFLEFFR